LTKLSELGPPITGRLQSAPPLRKKITSIFVRPAGRPSIGVICDK
jgi:hypothetical protein